MNYRYLIAGIIFIIIAAILAIINVSSCVPYQPEPLQDTLWYGTWEQLDYGKDEDRCLWFVHPEVVYIYDEIFVDSTLILPNYYIGTNAGFWGNPEFFFIELHHANCNWVQIDDAGVPWKHRFNKSGDTVYLEDVNAVPQNKHRTLVRVGGISCPPKCQM